ncbi:MAG: hypothetical protein ACOZCO_17685 [Bacteroidota bacterium]
MKTSFVYLFFVLACSITVMSCKTQSNAAAGNDKDVQKVIVDDAWSQPEDMMEVTITKAEISGDILTIDVSYSGGCEEHEFKLYFNGMYMKSLPPKITLVLYHNHKGDACRSIVDKKLKFDLTPVREKGKTTGEIMVKVYGLENAMSYKY